MTGESKVGKTTVCKRAVDLAVQRGYRCAGLLSAPLVEDGQCVGTNALNLADGRERELARADRTLSNLRYGKWSFNPATFEWGNALLRGLGECDLFIVDEIGPLELELGLGWVDAWGALERRRFAMAVVITRPKWANRLRNLIAAKEVLTATRVTRDDLPLQIVSSLERLAMPAPR